MAISTVRTRRSMTEVYIKKLAAGLIVLSFLIISVCVFSTEASLEYQMLYITFDSLFVYVIIRFLQWIAAKVLTIYEEIGSGQN